MARRPTYEELEQRVKELEKEATDLERAGERLKSGRDKLQSLMDGLDRAEIGIDIVGINYNVLFQNQILKERFGNLTGQLCYKNYIGLKEPCDFCPMIKAIRSNKVESVELTGGDGRNYEVLSAPLPNADGTVDKAIEVVKDITERKQAEEALRQSEARFRQIADTATDFIYNFDLEGVLNYCSPAAERILGYTPQELVGTNYIDYVSSTDIPKASEYFQRIISGEKFALFELELVKKDRVIIQVETSVASVISQGKLIGFNGIARDITERRQKEEALRESEEKYRQLADLLPQTVFETDGRGNLTFANRIAFDLFGYTSGDFEKGLNALNMLVPEDRDRALENIARVLKGKWLGGTEYTALTKDGNPFPVMIHTSPIIREDKPVGLRGIITDLTKLKEAEGALRRSEQRYRNLYNNAQVGIFRTRISDGKILEANHRAAQICGYDNLDEFISEYMFSEHYVDPGTRERMISELQKNNEIMNFEARFSRKDGSTIWARYSARSHSEGGYLEGVVTDVTEEKKAEKALQESEEKYRLLVENANDAIFIAQDGVVKFPNTRTLKTVGYSEEELAGIPFVDLIHPEDRDMVLERHRRRLKGEVLPSTYSFRVMDKAGQELWVELNTVLITWEGRPGTLNFLRDITERKQLETQLRQAQKIEAIGTLAGGLAHDFNNLLMAIQGNASLMLLKKDLGERGYTRLKNIEQCVRNGAELTNQLLGFAKGGKYEVKLADLNELLNRSSDMFGRTKKEISIHPKYQEGIWAVEVDQGQIEQVVMNLYINAWQAMPGGGKLFLETENVELDRNFVKPFGVETGKYVKISMTDTGVGMDKKTRERIFDPFFTTKEMSRGTGLGLASSYGIIKSHGGIIDVRSKKGEGSTFIIYLPASEKQIPRQKELAEEVLEGKGVILLVDDEEMIIDAAKEMLEEMGYTVLAAESGMEAIDTYRENADEIDMVILDMIMPDMDGEETYDKLRELDPRIRVLLSSGYSVDGHATEILERGCSGFIQKPFNMKEISHKIRQILDN